MFSPWKVASLFSDEMSFFDFHDIIHHRSRGRRKKTRSRQCPDFIDCQQSRANNKTFSLFSSLVPVACSTVTVTKCQAALRTLQAFPFFRPTCLCKEPGVDPDCNYFRDFLFDHPCGFVLKKGKPSPSGRVRCHENLIIQKENVHQASTVYDKWIVNQWN